MLLPCSRRASRAPLVVLLSLLGGTLIGCADSDSEGHAFPPPQVNVAIPLQQDVEEWAEYSGIVEAVDAVEIRPRVSGYLQSMHFEEGHTVSQGDLLFRIDDREYRAAVASARADLARAEARLQVAEQELARSAQLVKAKAVSQGELEVRQSEQSQANADRLAARARLQQAELTLSYAEISAPISGRIGAARIKPSNLVVADQSLLTTLVSIDPVYIGFESDEATFLRYQQQHRQDPAMASATAPLPVEVGRSDEAGFPHRGELVFLDNAINPATGTLHARARLANPDGAFTPGMFARVRLFTATRANALLIHEQAIQTDQDRRYVYVLGEGNTAQRRDLQLGPRIEALQVVEQGLDADQQVIVNGMRKIFFPGQPVAPITVPMAQPNQLPAEPAAANAAAQTEG